MKLLFPCCASTALLLVLALNLPAQDVRVRVDASQRVGKFKRLHGVNGGPLNYGETIDLTAAWRDAGIPSTRLHDCEWPSGRIADFHAIFPDLKADPKDPANYRWAETDAYLKAIAASGARVVFRLGESIEHTQVKHYVHPPADFERWAAVCVEIVRRYEAKAGKEGFPKIDYWEIWNEPENQPAMWTGTNEQFFSLFNTTGRRLKKEFPHLKIGGPALGATGEVKDGKFLPHGFTRDFLAHCQKHQTPLDFFSWHTYSNDPAVYARKAKAIRAWLDEQGYAKSELHLNEWNYLPRNDWSAISRQATPTARTKWFEQQGGSEGAAFAAYVLLDLQDSPIDVANYFSGDTGPFGLFHRYGEPKKTYFAFHAFQQLLQTPVRIKAEGRVEGKLCAQAALSEGGDEVRVLVAHYRSAGPNASLVIENLPWQGSGTLERQLVNAECELAKSVQDLTVADSGKLEVSLAAAPAVELLRIRRRN